VSERLDDELRRISRVSVCCRAVVRDHYGIWTGVTEDLSIHGCQIVTGRLLRPGTLVTVTLSSDLFPEELEVAGETAWATPDRLGVRFLSTVPRSGGLSVEAWLWKVVEQGRIPETSSTWRVAPSVIRAPRRPTLLRSASSRTPAPQPGEQALERPSGSS
jgi:hypothetical protein